MKYDLIVIGAGPGGYVAAIRAGQLGLKTLVIEKWKVGGVCLNVGCIPTKALLHAAHTVDSVKGARKFGVEADVKLDVQRLNAWKERVVNRLVKGVEFLFKKNGVELIGGEGDSNDAVALKEIPDSLLIVGAGAVGLEFAYVYKKLGTERVVVVDIMDQVLPGTDREMAHLYARILKKEGIEVRLRTTVKAVEEDGSVVLSSGDREVVERYDRVLVAVGRVPNTEFLNGRGFVVVNERTETNLPGVLAIGDITPGPMLAHRAQKEGVLAAEVSVGLNVRKSWKYVPAVVYTYPEYATVGLTEPLSALGRAHTMGGVEGAVKVVAERGSGKLLGVHIVSPEASAIVSEAALALERELTVEDLESVIHPHPTTSEALMEAAANVLKRAIHIVN